MQADFAATVTIFVHEVFGVLKNTFLPLNKDIKHNFEHFEMWKEVFFATQSIFLMKTEQNLGVMIFDKLND